MKSRSATASSSKESNGIELERTNIKRPYNRKSLLCRLCLRVLPKEQLPEIFEHNNNIQKAIRTAVGTEVTRKDRSNRICFCCLELVHLINDFRGSCERTELLFTQNVEISDSAFWIDESDQKVFGKCRALVEQCKTEVDNIFTDQSEFFCNVQTEQLLDESCDAVQRSIAEPIVKREETYDINDVDVESSIIKEEPHDEQHLDQIDTDSEPDFEGSDTDDPDYKIEDQPEQKEEEVEPSSTTTAKRKKRESGGLPRRRGRPSLPEELLKRRRRKPGEPKKKPGPKNRIKLPAQSVCEICGMMVSRENQERHRNDHLGNRPYACTVEGCSHAFSSKAGLHGHLARHADRNNVYDCDICGAKIKTKSSLHRHRKMHTTEKPHACDICGKRFWRKSYLNHHATVHTGIAKFPCEYCGFVFKNKYWRSFHIKQKHVAKGEAPKFEALEELEENGEMAEVMEEGMEMGMI
ncbi:zinc finger protein 189-like [Ochlerotatus camptorhynchus]|uniref:zinc finger protein 189-like n=1 Tax=Ochlerotatus camptorhynchus TaxID=644619 RepID=UPI0031E43195